jgi:hypothetical protein
VTVNPDHVLPDDDRANGVPGSPIRIQINGHAPQANQQQGKTTTDWSPTAGDQQTGWAQYGAKMWPNTTRLIARAQYWNPAVSAVTFTANIPNADTATLPSDLTITGGWKIRFTFSYSPDNSGTITGYDCRVTDNNGQTVVANMPINFLDPPNALTSGGRSSLATCARWTPSRSCWWASMTAPRRSSFLAAGRSRSRRARY